MSATIAAQLDAIDVLADELTLLSAELGEEAQLCRSTAASLGAALSGEAGDRAGAAGSGWALVLDLLASQTGSLAATLHETVRSYRRTDAILADRVLEARQGTATR
ncbi:hypothetical protein [Geodermatophilus sp. CPCC 206100]|uniref:hypothetical protein n=1 Tax=Geodermatophilus sp. CPCC 206100 TaxID=3020054 RepID=UPI003B00C7A8